MDIKEFLGCSRGAFEKYREGGNKDYLDEIHGNCSAIMGEIEHIEEITDEDFLNKYVGTGIVKVDYGDVLLDIGSVESSGCRLRDVDIKEEYQGEGYGKKAVEEWVNKRKDICGEVETTAVTSPAMESILLDLGFKRDEDEPSHFVKNLEGD